MVAEDIVTETVGEETRQFVREAFTTADRGSVVKAGEIWGTERAGRDLYPLCPGSYHSWGKIQRRDRVKNWEQVYLRARPILSGWEGAETAMKGRVVILVLRWDKVGNPRGETFFFFQREFSFFLGHVVVSEARREHTVCKAGDMEILL